MKKLTLILTILIVLTVVAVPAAVKAYSGIPTFSIVSVITDAKVTIQTNNFPANKDFKVLLGVYGTRGVGGTQIATTNSGSGGAFQVTYTIPDAFKGLNRIAIRLEATSGGYYAYNWFYNNTTPTLGPTPTTGPTPTPGYSGIPTFAIESVVVDSKVTIKTNNFPANYDFKVLMGAYGTRGIGGTLVTTVNSGAGGSFTGTYDIPAALHGAYRIAIRLEATTGGFFAYNWFYNSTTTLPTPVPGYSGIPTFTISAVVANSKVTILTNNFPAGLDFKVLMGAYGTKGIGGTLVKTINSGTGGAFSETFDIPAAFNGAYRIAIRLESTSGIYYAYNWFYNSTTP
jgi:hypothetical protein